MGIIGHMNRAHRVCGSAGFLIEDRVAAGRARDLLAGLVAEGAVIGNRAVVVIATVTVAVQEVEQARRRRRGWRARDGYRGWGQDDRGADRYQRSSDVVQR